MANEVGLIEGVFSSNMQVENKSLKKLKLNLTLSLKCMKKMSAT